MSWLKKAHGVIAALLADKIETLRSWQIQELTTQKRVKNFENWLLVELVHRFSESGARIKTNGYLEDTEHKKQDRWIKDVLIEAGSRSRKTRVGSLSPDICIRPPGGTDRFTLEIKTQLSPQEILTDARITACRNSTEADGVVRHGFLWVVVLPSNEELYRRASKSCEHLELKSRELDLDLKLEAVRENPWIRFCLSAPNRKSGTSQ